MVFKLRAAVLMVVVVVVASAILLRVHGTRAAPSQPIEFNHRQHVTDPEGPQLDCVFCHEYADRSSHATVPNISTCMACHGSIAADRPEVRKLAAFAERGDQPPWVRIYSFPASANVFFSHKPHVRSGVECSKCHGSVATSVRLHREIEPTMGWCIDCHRQRGASIDCYICHR
jgi:Cytochrome c7 and related cytochrome c